MTTIQQPTKEQVMTDHSDHGFAHRRTRHIKTGAEGLITGATATLYPEDVTGPWSYVRFDDGLECWVQTEDLEQLHNVKLLPPYGPAMELSDDCQVMIQVDGNDRLGLAFDNEGVECGTWDKDHEWWSFGRIEWATSAHESPKTTGLSPTTDGLILDRMADMLASGMGPEHGFEWPSAAGALEDLAGMVDSTGRDIKTPRPNVVWESH